MSSGFTLGAVTYHVTKLLKLWRATIVLHTEVTSYLSLQAAACVCRNSSSYLLSQRTFVREAIQVMTLYKAFALVVERRLNNDGGQRLAQCM